MLRRLKRALGIAMLGLVALAALVYAGDYAVFRLRVKLQRNPYGSVVVEHYDAVQLKNGKTSFLFDPPGPQTCSNSLFPRDGYQPCWYLVRHPEQRTDI